MMKKSAVEILQEKIDYFTRFKIKVETRDGIIEASQDKLDRLVCETEVNIAELEKAIEVLNYHAMAKQEFVDKMSLYHLQNLSGREDFVEAFQKGLEAAFDELVVGEKESDDTKQIPLTKSELLTGFYQYLERSHMIKGDFDVNEVVKWYKHKPEGLQAVRESSEAEDIAIAKGIWSTGKRLEPIRIVVAAKGMSLKEARQWCEENFS